MRGFFSKKNVYQYKYNKKIVNRTKFLYLIHGFVMRIILYDWKNLLFNRLNLDFFDLCKLTQKILRLVLIRNQLWIVYWRETFYYHIKEIVYNVK